MHICVGMYRHSHDWVTLNGLICLYKKIINFVMQIHIMVCKIGLIVCQLHMHLQLAIAIQYSDSHCNLWDSDVDVDHLVSISV